MKRFTGELARLALYFVTASFLGHWIEILVMLVSPFIGLEVHAGVMARPLEPYPIYGIAVVAMVLLWKILPVKLKKNPFMLFGALTLVCAVAEYIAGWSITRHFGYNPYWNYTQMPLNLHGHICLFFSLFFGLIATLFMWFAYPRGEKLLNKLSWWALVIIAIGAALAYTVCHLAFGG